MRDQPSHKDRPQLPADAQALVAAIRPLLAGYLPEMQAVALRELLIQFVIEQRHPQRRRESIQLFRDAILALGDEAENDDVRASAT